MKQQNGKWVIAWGLAALLTTACGQSDFAGKNGLWGGATVDKTGKTVDAGTDSGKPGPGDDTIAFPDPKPNSDEDAINKCLQKFGAHPFDQEGVRSYRRLHASVSVLGFGSGIVDDRVSQEPELVLISATVNVMSDVVYQLLNPNGWYCLKVDVNVKAKTRIDLHCNARLADNKVNVNVMSNSRPTGMVGVHVMSEVDIQRVGGCQ